MVLGPAPDSKPVKVEIHHAAESSVDEFRKVARSYLGEPGHFVLINYLRRAIGQESGAHISPLGAYDEKSDRFLILDVARYKYPPVWAKASDLFDAMNTPDPSNEGKTRGYVVVGKAEAGPEKRAEKEAAKEKTQTGKAPVVGLARGQGPTSWR